MGQHNKAATEGPVIKQRGEECKRSEAQNDHNYNMQQTIRAQTTALGKLTVAYGNIKWKQ